MVGLKVEYLTELTVVLKAVMTVDLKVDLKAVKMIELLAMKGK